MIMASILENEMSVLPHYHAIGLMSGTSLDGVDAALIVTDGVGIVEPKGGITLPYPEHFRQELKALLTGKGDVLAVEHQLTLFHIEAVKQLLVQTGNKPSDIHVIGFHGQTLTHRPKEHLTWQMGDASFLAQETEINVVSDFRRRDMAAGGQGAPLVPIYHAAITKTCPKPVAVVNIGGVANVTWIGHNEEELIAFDTGPGNALVDDWIFRHTGKHYDEQGAIAARGKVHEDILVSLLSHPYFKEPPPKSLDRNSFSPDAVQGLSLEDGAATLTAFTARAIIAAQAHFPQVPLAWYVCGGGRHNHTLTNMLTHRINAEVQPIETLGFDGDALEAQAFGYLAVRSLKKLPLTFPSTTGVRLPLTGGVFCPV